MRVPQPRGLFQQHVPQRLVFEQRGGQCSVHRVAQPAVEHLAETGVLRESVLHGGRREQLAEGLLVAFVGVAHQVRQGADGEPRGVGGRLHGVAQRLHRGGAVRAVAAEREHCVAACRHHERARFCHQHLVGQHGQEVLLAVAVVAGARHHPVPDGGDALGDDNAELDGLGGSGRHGELGFPIRGDAIRGDAIHRVRNQNIQRLAVLPVEKRHRHLAVQIGFTAVGDFGTEREGVALAEEARGVALQHQRAAALQQRGDTLFAHVLGMPEGIELPAGVLVG